MSPIRISRTASRVLVLAVSAGALGCSLAAVSGASTPPLTTASAPPKTITARLIRSSPGGLAPGTKVRSGAIFGNRVFTDAKHGFALASPPDADYAVATSDGGKTWRIDSPALHRHAANAPLVVLYIDAVSRKSVFAWGGGQVIDTTSNGGRTWYQTLFPTGGPIAVVPAGFGGQLLAFVGSFSGTGTWRYTSKDGGRTWRR
ncbi:MAG: hypothetical protein JO363_05220 [Solirubrobacterales bacterium]|nr:hypothetical protein [Solirubrobacterales bacterium]